MATAQPPKSICILRLSALGDVTHVIPVLRVLQAAWPAVEITWICGSLEHRLLSCIPGVRFVVFDKRKGLRAFREARRALDGQRFDVLLHMQVAARANLLSLSVAADTRLGWDSASSRDLHQLFINRRIEAGRQRHQVDSFLAFARALGLAVDKPRWDIPIAPQSYDFAREHIDEARKTLVISPCSSHPLRNWAVGRYARVADHAVQQLGMQVILSGGPGAYEKRFGAAIQEAMSSAALNLVGRDTLQQSLALLERAAVVIAPDSGPAHMANAVGTPVIGLYACTNPARSGPYDSLAHCVNRYPEAAAGFAGKPAAEMRWGSKIEQAGVMDLIEVAEVVQKLEAVVA